MRRQRRRARILALGFESLDSRRVLASITGVVFADDDLSGLQDNGESGLPNRIVYIDQNHDNRLNGAEPYQLTDGSGSFAFEDLPADAYSLRMFDGTGTQKITAPESGVHSIFLTADASVGQIDFGVQISGENEAPISDPVHYATKQGLSFVLPFPNGLVYKHGADTPNQTFVALQTSESENSLVEISLAGGLHYIPADDFVGQDTATYVLHDGRDASDPITLTVDVVDKDAPLQTVVFDGDPLPENSPAGTVIGKLSVLAPSLQGNIVFAPLTHHVQINDNLLILADPALVNFEVAPEVRVLVQVLDLDLGEEVSQVEIVIPVSDADDPIRFLGGPEYGDTDEHATGTSFGIVYVEDEDVGEQHTIEVEDSRFEIVNGMLKLRDDEALTYPDDDGLVVNYTVDDPAPGGTQHTNQITITVFNLNDPPTALNVSGGLREKIYGATVGPVTVIDPDPHDTYHYTISDPRFEIVAGVLKLRDDQTVDYAGPSSSITMNITATENSDANYSVESEVTIPILENASPWQNLPESLDVNNDNVITPQDVLIILNSLNEGGPRPLNSPFDGEYYLDVNGDGLLTPLDALIVVNELNTISNLKSIPGGGFPPIGESESTEDAPPSPEGESIAEAAQTESAANQDHFAAPSIAQPLMVADADQEPFDEDEDWLETDLEDLFV
ncbi:dockerin type I domain-containing protein [Rosistilla ulvae]|uniref:dockerin type I domain-containing protein n=1 Tax=Rosistilla ulvae TaxID=1930277 RepID=UPI001C54F159|nr:dockerin type I domain-containing protein [Rosistilla ulvae]